MAKIISLIPKSNDKITSQLTKMITEIAEDIESFYQGYLELGCNAHSDEELKKYHGGFFIHYQKRQLFCVARNVLSITTKIKQDFWTAKIDSTVPKEVREKILLIFQKNEKDLLNAGIKIVMLNQ